MDEPNKVDVAFNFSADSVWEQISQHINTERAWNAVKSFVDRQILPQRAPGSEPGPGLPGGNRPPMPGEWTRQQAGPQTGTMFQGLDPNIATAIRGRQSSVKFNDGRQYDVYVPRSYDPSQPMATMFVLHGAGVTSKMKSMAAETGMNQMAEERNFIVVYPHARPRTIELGAERGQQGSAWNVSNARNLAPTLNEYSDVDFLDKVMSNVAMRFNVDRNAMYMAGFSDGGRMVHRFATERPGRLAAIASVHGTVLGDERKPAQGEQKPAVMIVHSLPGARDGSAGTTGFLRDDMMLPWKGGLGAVTSSNYTGGLMEGVRYSQPSKQAELWLDNPASPRHTQTIDGVVRTSINDGGRRVEQYLVIGGQHAWHGTMGNGGMALVGERSKNLEVTKEVANFLLQHRLSDGSMNIQRTLSRAA